MGNPKHVKGKMQKKPDRRPAASIGVFRPLRYNTGDLPLFRHPAGPTVTLAPIMDDLTTKALEFVRGHSLLRPGQGVLVGLSGGPDSVALTLMLEEFASSGGPPLDIHLGHLNHGLRGEESDADEEFCRRFAAEHSLDIETGRVEVAQMVRPGRSIEAAARKARYAFLTELARSKGLDTIALGHHADDVAETVLMRIMRGCGIRGLGALAPVRPAGPAHAGMRIIRPLLELTRDELLDFLKRRGQPFRTDSSNLDTAFLRNRVRGEIIPALQRDSSVSMTEALCALNAAALKINALMDALLDAEWETLCVRADAGAVALEAGGYARLAPGLRKLAVRRALTMLAPADRPPGLSRQHYEAAAELAGRPVGTKLTLPGGFTACHEHGLIFLSAGGGEAGVSPVELPVPGSVALEDVGLSITSEVTVPPPVGQQELIARSGPREIFLSLEALELPLAVRSRRPGDRFHPLGAPGARKLKEFFIDRKVPRHERDRTPLVVDASGRIAWVVGHAIAEAFKLTGSETSILHLSAQ